MPDQKHPNQMPQTIVPHGVIGRLIGVLREVLNWQAYKWALRHMPRDRRDRVLEIGFGTGRLATMCVKSGGMILYAGVDPSIEMIEITRRRLMLMDPNVTVDLRQVDDRELDWLEGSFDIVLAVHSFQFWTDADSTLRVISRLLAPEGKLILIQRMHGKHPPEWLPNPYCKGGDQRAGARKALHKAGFAVVQDRRINPRSYGLVAEVRTPVV